VSAVTSTPRFFIQATTSFGVMNGGSFSTEVVDVVMIELGLCDFKQTDCTGESTLKPEVVYVPPIVNISVGYQDERVTPSLDLINHFLQGYELQRVVIQGTPQNRQRGESRNRLVCTTRSIAIQARKDSHCRE